MRELFYMSIILVSSCTMTKSINSSLEGQRWIWSKELKNAGVSTGNSWIFLSNNRFSEKSWYSGGAYFTYNYTGTYYYNADNKTVFLRYDKEQTNPPKFIRSCIQLTVIDNATIPVFYNSWKKIKGIYVSQQKAAPEPPIHITAPKLTISTVAAFKIELITGDATIE